MPNRWAGSFDPSSGIADAAAGQIYGFAAWLLVKLCDYGPMLPQGRQAAASPSRRPDIRHETIELFAQARAFA